MSQTSQPEASAPAVSVLAVSPHPEDHRALENIFAHTNWQLRTVGSYSEAAAALQLASYPVVICDYRLPDGSWQDVETLCRTRTGHCRVVVSSRNADDGMWAEVLNEGGYDCLLKPFRRDEVATLVSLAWRSWKNECERTAPKQLRAAAG